MIHIYCDDHGLTRIKLPGPGIPSGKNETRRTQKENPGFLNLAAQQICEYCKGERKVFDLPLSLHGTRFQSQVWEIIRSIPYGQTMTYGKIAQQLGNKGKARAVGSAANANPLPLVIPCHRVIGANGALTGFAGGIELKKTLLNLEKSPA